MVADPICLWASSHPRSSIFFGSDVIAGRFSRKALMRILVTGGDGFCGWPTVLHLSRQGHEIVMIDSLVRRRIADELGAQSLVPIASVEERLGQWQAVTGRKVGFLRLDISREADRLKRVVGEFQPDHVIHLAAQRSAPYSMSSPTAGAYTLENNILAAHALLQAVAAQAKPARFIHLGSIGVYGYNDHTHLIPEKVTAFSYADNSGAVHSVTARFPNSPTSLYHTSKAMLTTLLDYYVRVHRIEAIDLLQGIVWGTQTAETSLDPALVNRFDYDEQYGTVVNRFIVQACSGKPLTVYGSGNQTRAFIHINDMVRCIDAAIHREIGEFREVTIMHQVAETKTVLEVAQIIARHTDAGIVHIPNPRGENEKHALHLELAGFRELNLELRAMDAAIADEIASVVRMRRAIIDLDSMMPSIIWNTRERPAN
jgi:UDP-sulfoquinovose synthase